MAALLFLNILQLDTTELDRKNEIAPLENELFKVLYLRVHLSINISQSSILIAFPYSNIRFLRIEPSLRSSNFKPRNLSVVSWAVIFAESGGSIIRIPLISIKTPVLNFITALVKILMVSEAEIVNVSLNK